jgi:hypothetical protein
MTSRPRGEKIQGPGVHPIVRPSYHALTAAFGILASSGAIADKGSNGGPPFGVGFGNGRGGSRFIDSAGAGPASAFDQRAQLVKSGGLEFKATGSALAPSAREDTARAGGSHGASSAIKPGGDGALPAQGSATGTSAKPAAVGENVATAFAPWKVTDKDGKPVDKKAALECSTK